MNIFLISIMFLFALELAVIDTMFCARLPKRKGFAGKALGCALLAAAYIILVPQESVPYFLFHLPIVTVSFIYILLCYEVNLREGVFLWIAGYTIQHISSLLNSIVTYFFPRLFEHIALDGGISFTAYLLILGIDALVFLAAYFLIIRHLGALELRKNATVPVILLGAAVIVFNQLGTVSLSLFGASSTDSPYALMEDIWNLIACVLSLTIEFHIFSISRKDTELEVARKLMADKERQYKMTKSSVDAINRKCHDLKYQLAAIDRGGDVSAHVTEALELVDSFDSAVRTGNDTLDVIFTEKNFYCKKHDIVFVCMIDGEKLNFMDVTDQYVLLGNIIDNAINAVRQIPEHAKRSIYVKIFAEKKLLFIQTENPFLGSLEFSDGLPRTTTGDDFNHGFGMSSIRIVAEKYGGSVNTRAQDGVFYLNVVLPLQ